MCKALVVSSHDISPKLWSESCAHMEALAKRYGFRTVEISRYGFNIIIVVDSNNKSIVENIDAIHIVCGSISDHSYEWDRYLSVKISDRRLEVTNDYAGSIPIFYSQRNGLVLSNIEPCVFLGSESSLNDLSAENIYGFLRYSHFIWDETAWSHIKQMLPDSRYVFSSTGELLSVEYLETVKASDSRAGLTDKQVANELFELNQSLVNRSLADADEIILPLSSGYDSRMIFSVLANDRNLISKTRCFTYGSVGSIEVEGGRRLSQLKGMEWHHVELPCKFLDIRYLKEVSDIFGASLHMHGMYQIEFYDQIKAKHGVSPTGRLTSGFMTGVPAGQHNGLLKITDSNGKMTDAMNQFSQSNIWKDEDLEKMPIFSGKRYLEKAEERFRLAFDRFGGAAYQRAVMFDVWTRQRNFISYYPRVFEWLCPVASPHMCVDYANFFMSLNKDHLWNRKAVELMFLRHYPDIARVASNSNGIASLGSQFETGLFFLSRIFNRLGMPNPLPKRFHNSPIEFDIQAVINCAEDSFYPLLEDTVEIRRFADAFGGIEMFFDLYHRAHNGDGNAYARAVTFQAVALNGLLGISHSNGV